MDCLCADGALRRRLRLDDEIGGRCLSSVGGTHVTTSQKSAKVALTAVAFMIFLAAAAYLADSMGNTPLADLLTLSALASSAIIFASILVRVLSKMQDD